MTAPPVGAFDNEIDLLSAVARGHPAAIAALYRAHADAVFRFVYRRVEDRYEDAEEITQDTFLAALNLAAGYHGKSSASTWLCGIAKLRITDFYRRHDRDKRVPRDRITSLAEVLDTKSEVPDPSQNLDLVVERMAGAALMDRLMSLLGDDEREVLLCRYVEEMSVREIGGLMNRTEKAIESLLTRAKRRVREAILDRP